MAYRPRQDRDRTATAGNGRPSMSPRQISVNRYTCPAQPNPVQPNPTPRPSCTHAVGAWIIPPRQAGMGRLARLARPGTCALFTENCLGDTLGRPLPAGLGWTKLVMAHATHAGWDRGTHLVQVSGVAGIMGGAPPKFQKTVVISRDLRVGWAPVFAGCPTPCWQQLDGVAPRGRGLRRRRRRRLAAGTAARAPRRTVPRRMRDEKCGGKAAPHRRHCTWSTSSSVELNTAGLGEATVE
eukprot:gene7548-biopygen4555